MAARAAALTGGAGPGDVADDVPRGVRPDPAPRGQAVRLPVLVLDLRPGRLAAADGPGLPRARPGRQVPPAEGAWPHQVSNLKNELIDYETVAARASGYREKALAEAYAEYQRRLVAAGAMDFDDLIMVTVNLLQAFPDVAAEYRARFRHVLVDEYQDTNHAQYVLVTELAGQLRTPRRGSAPPMGRAAQPARRAVRRRRRRPVHLRLPRRHDQEHRGVRARLPRRHGHPARAELPLHPEHPGRGQRRRLPQPRPGAEEAVVRGR